MTLAFLGASVLFLPKLIQRAMKADVKAAIETFGKNEPVKKSVLDNVRLDGRAGLGESAGPGDGPAGGGGITGMGG